jgi:hypothetical protein
MTLFLSNKNIVIKTLSEQILLCIPLPVYEKQINFTEDAWFTSQFTKLAYDSLHSIAYALKDKNIIFSYP